MKYNNQQIFPETGRFSPRHPPAHVVIIPNGGEVQVEADAGDGTWVTLKDSPFTEADSFQFAVGNGRFRFTPTGGAEYGFSA